MSFNNFGLLRPAAGTYETTTPRAQKISATATVPGSVIRQTRITRVRAIVALFMAVALFTAVNGDVADPRPKAQRLPVK